MIPNEKRLTMYVMNDQERSTRETIKALHRKCREAMREARENRTWKADPKPLYWFSHRYTLLAWGYVRGFPYRRIERSHHVQILPDGRAFEHNLPSGHELYNCLHALGLTPTKESVKAWLEDPSGAIPAPPPRVKKPYVAPQPVAAE
jgi:hypothetical protein